MPDQPANPIIMPYQRFNARASRIPDLDGFVAGPRREVFPAGTLRRGFFQAGELGEERVCGCRGESTAFQDVVVAKEGDARVSGRGVPHPGGLVCGYGEEVPAVEGGGYSPNPICVAAEGFDAVSCGDVPDLEVLIPRRRDE